MAAPNLTSYPLPSRQDVDITAYPMGDIPNLPPQIPLDNGLSIVPIGFSSMMVARINLDMKTVVLDFLQSEEGNSSISIPAKCLAPMTFGILFPRFIFEMSTLTNEHVSYSASSGLVVNQNQLLWLIIHHRLIHFSSSSKNHFVGLLRDDISRFLRYIDSGKHYSKNAVLKARNMYAIVSPWKIDPDNEGEAIVPHPIGQYLVGGRAHAPFTKSDFDSLSRDLHIQPASEGTASKGRKLVLSAHHKSFYKCAGYSTIMMSSPAGKFPAIRTIYKNKPNTPARFKTHILADCFNFVEPSHPIFIQDVYPGSTDRTMKDALVVFDEMSLEDGRLLCGEVESSFSFSELLVYREVTVLKVISSLAVSVGEDLVRSNAVFVLGTDAQGQDVVVKDARLAYVQGIERIGVEDLYSIRLLLQVPLGSCRLISTTGLKGVTKVKPSLGSVQLLDPDGEPIMTSTEVGGTDEPTILPVDLVTGMNAIKADGNSIHLAKAALSYAMGLSGSAPLNSLSVKQVSEAAASIGQCLWTDEFGETKLVWCGLIQVRVSELATMYARVKPQKFMPEAGRYLRDNGYSSLADIVWDLGVEQKAKDVVLELQKVLTDEDGRFAQADGLPIYTPDQLYQPFGVDDAGVPIQVFRIDDCHYDMNPMFPLVGRLLDEEYNRGWYLDLSARNGGLVRMPSAHLINALVRELPDGSMIYPSILRQVSRVLAACIVPNSDGSRSIGFLNDHNTHRSKGNRIIPQYLATVSGMVYKNQTSFGHSNLIETLLKPRLPGIGMKQVAEHHLPLRTVVILNPVIYARLASESGGYASEHGFFYGLCIRNPCVWKSQIQGFRVWDYGTYQLHLLSAHGISLNDYLVQEHSGNVLLLNPFDALRQMSDVDGDLMPLFMVNSMQGQEEIARLADIKDTSLHGGGVDNIVPQEITWLNEYMEEELSSNKYLELSSHPFALHSIPLRDNPMSRLSFKDYYRDSVTAKGDVGSATVNLWYLNTLLEVYIHLIETKGGNGLIHKSAKMSHHDKDVILYSYCRNIQELVIRAIKHVTGGSSGFEPYLLRSLMRANQSSSMKYMISDLGLTRDCVKEFYMMMNWVSSAKVLFPVSSFVSMFNSGKYVPHQPSEMLSLIEGQSYYGQLLSEMYSIRDHTPETILASYTRPRYLGVASDNVQAPIGPSQSSPVEQEVLQPFFSNNI